ncbi:MAG: hypothetical protein ACE5MH_11060, partial [Terriglobia bacterium]
MASDRVGSRRIEPEADAKRRLEAAPSRLRAAISTRIVIPPLTLPAPFGVEQGLACGQAYWRQIISSLRTLDAWVGRLGSRPKLRAAIQELEGQYKLRYGAKP